MKILVTECQQVQGRELLNYAYATVVSISAEEERIMKQKYEVARFKNKATIYCNSYYGDDAANKAIDKIINEEGRIIGEQYEEYVVEQYEVEFDVVGMSEDELFDSEIIQKICEF